MRSSVVTVVFLFIASAALAQWEPPDAPPNRPDNGGPPNVYFAHSYFPSTPHMAGLDDRISVHVQNFSTLLKQANGNCQGIVLFLDGMPIKGDKAESCDPTTGHIRYRLLRTPGDDNAWHTLLGSPSGYKTSVGVSVGSDEQFSIPTSARFDLEIIPRLHFFTFLALFAIALGIFVHLCHTTSLIRSGSHPVPHERPYSLSLFQMSFWFFLVIAAYVFVWLITDELDTITDSVLALIGIGAATALAAALIDQKKPTPAPDTPGGTSRGFLTDVMSDATGVSLHRFQMFVWTLVLGVIFCGSVYKNLGMPEFSATLLGLMGISSGTYLGFKVPEKTGSDTPPGATPDPVPATPPLPPPPIVPPA
jgi:hypothetical protein